MPNINKKESTPLLRLRDFIQWAQDNGLCKTFYDFEKQCGLSPRYIANSTANGKGDISTAILGKIITKYPMLNLVWLCTGEGEMFHGGVRMDYYKAYKEKCRDVDVLKSKLSAIKEIIK